jgi:outer membrane biosynthesis protein TonB
MLALLLAMAAVLVALGAGFFGLATLSREGVATPVPTPPTAVAKPTAPAKPIAVPTETAQPATPTTEPTATPQPTPSPSPVPATATPPRPTSAPTPAPAPAASPASRAVPQLRGKQLDQAQAALQAAGLTATVRGVNANADKDVVVDQQPDVGTTLPPGGTVTIMVGTGSTPIPDVANMPADQAMRTLQNNSFHVTPRQRRDQRIPPGMAIETQPSAGAVVPRNSEVLLFISSGR